MKPARHYTDLIVWQLAEQIRIEVFKLTEKPRFSADFKARAQADDSADSMTRNIAEGFGCETHAEFARFLEISRRSLNELHDVLHGAQLKRHVTFSEVTPIRQLSKRLYPAYSRFIAYLKRTPNFRPRRGGPPPKEAADRAQPRTDGRKQTRTGKHSRDRTDQRQETRLTRIQNRTDKRQTDRTDKRSNDRTDERQSAIARQRDRTPTQR